MGVAAVLYDAPRYPSIMSRHMYHGVSMDTMCAVRHGAARARVSGFSRTKTLLVSVFCFPWGSAHAQQWLCAPPRAARGAGAPPRARQGFNESTVEFGAPAACSLQPAQAFSPQFCDTVYCRRPPARAAAPAPLRTARLIYVQYHAKLTQATHIRPRKLTPCLPSLHAHRI